MIMEVCVVVSVVSVVGVPGMGRARSISLYLAALTAYSACTTSAEGLTSTMGTAEPRAAAVPAARGAPTARMQHPLQLPTQPCSATGEMDLKIANPATCSSKQGVPSYHGNPACLSLCPAILELMPS